MTMRADDSTSVGADAVQQDGAPADVPRAVRGPLQRFRVAAMVTGVGLLGMLVVMVIRYGFGNATPSAVYSPIHGVVYMVYMAMVADLAIKARWSVKGSLLVLLAGCIPFVSFLAERKVTRRVRAGLSV
jgi:integral membrane protein